MKPENPTKNTILLIHQSSDLYGSDKTLLILAKAIKRDSQWNPIVIVPAEGLLVNALKEHGIAVHITPVLKVSRELLSPKNLWKLPFRIKKEIKRFKALFKKDNIKIIHSNTLAVLIGAFVYRDLRAKHIWHVHEMIEKPFFVKKLYHYFLPKNSDVIIANSKATEKFWLNNRFKLKEKFKMVYNGLDVLSKINDDEIKRTREEIFNVPENAIVIGLVGRINQYKGHEVLLKAFEEIYLQYPNVYIVMVGSAPPGKEILKENLKNNIQNLKCREQCRLIDFQQNISEIWNAIDIATVPTTIAESFGLVALEAMLAKKPVVASSIGGLKEVIIHEETGYLFEPNNVDDLKNKLELLIHDAKLRLEMGEKGYNRAVQQFSLDNYTKSILEIYSQIIE